MPMFYFDVREADGSITEDHYGLELPSADAAIREASKALGELAVEEIRANVNDFEIRIRTKDESGNELSCRCTKVSAGSFEASD